MVKLNLKKNSFDDEEWKNFLFNWFEIRKKKNKNKIYSILVFTHKNTKNNRYTQRKNITFTIIILFFKSKIYLL
jgi:hypothetical protein